jgi:hypothetical protein
LTSVGRKLISGCCTSRHVTMRRPRLRGAIETVDGGVVDFTYPSGPCRSQPSSRLYQREQRPARWGWQDG